MECFQFVAFTSHYQPRNWKSNDCLSIDTLQKRKRFERPINVLVFNLKSNELNLFESDIYVLNSYLFPTFVRTLLTVWCLRDSYLYGCLSKLTHQNNDTLFKQKCESRDKRKKKKNNTCANQPTLIYAFYWTYWIAYRQLLRIDFTTSIDSLWICWCWFLRFMKYILLPLCCFIVDSEMNLWIVWRLRLMQILPRIVPTNCAWHFHWNSYKTLMDKKNCTILIIIF